jgi:hypothetical protein
LSIGRRRPLLPVFVVWRGKWGRSNRWYQRSAWHGCFLARFKEGITPMNKVSEAILSLKPVTFRYKEELDPDRIPQFGVVAEEVEKIHPSTFSYAGSRSAPSLG